MENLTPEKELHDLEQEWTVNIKSIKTFVNIFQNDLFEVRSTQAKLGEIQSRFEYTFKIHLSFFENTVYHDRYNKMMESFRVSMASENEMLERRAQDLISTDPEKCIDEKVNLIKERIWNSPEGLTISGLEILQNTVKEFKMMLLDWKIRPI